MRLLIAASCLLLSGCVSYTKADTLASRIAAVEANINGYEREVRDLGDIAETNSIEWVKNTAVNQQWNDEDLMDTISGIRKRAQSQRDIATDISRDRMELAEIRYELGGAWTAQ